MGLHSTKISFYGCQCCNFVREAKYSIRLQVNTKNGKKCREGVLHSHAFFCQLFWPFILN